MASTAILIGQSLLFIFFFADGNRLLNTLAPVKPAIGACPVRVVKLAALAAPA
jgi:hypothetical protein